MITPELPLNVSTAYGEFPEPARTQLLLLRDLIFEVASDNPSIGSIHETLKWGEPAYLTLDTKSGSTVRLASKPASPELCGIYLNCNTTLIADMRDIYPNDFSYCTNRAALVPAEQPPSKDTLSHCLELALTYHARKRRT